MHEWIHGFAGHARAARARIGVTGFDEADRSAGPHAEFRRALEFEADAGSLILLRDQITNGADVPSSLLGQPGGPVLTMLWLALAVSIVIAHVSQIEASEPIPERLHPPAGVRYLRMWDTVHDLDWRETLPEGANTELLSITGPAAIYSLANVCPAFTALEGVTPMLFQTPNMKKFRREMNQYNELIKRIDAQPVRHNMHGDVADGLPRRST